MRRNRKLRSSSGLSIVVLMSFIGIFIIGPLSMFIFELARYNLADQQLKNCVDLAALTAACSTTASDSSSTTVTQTAAMNQAAYMFSQNSIFAQPLTTTPAYTYGTAAATMTPAANQAQLYFQFLNPTTKQPVSYGDPSGKILRITGAWGFVPSTAKFIGIGAGPYTIVEQSDGGLPMLDVVLCLDLSGSMDDFTNVSFVKRYDSGVGFNVGTIKSGTMYQLAGGNVYNGHTLGQGPLYYAVGCTNTTGCSINATWPLDYFNSSNISSAAVQLYCDYAGHGPHHALPPPNTLVADTNQYTDVVVNLDGSDTMSYGCTVNNSYGSFAFPAYNGDTTGKSLGILTEAARGNLESTVIATAAKIPYTAWGITPKPGWYAAYYQAVMSTDNSVCTISTGNPTAAIPLRHPIGDAIVAAQNFFSVMNNDADVHFGLVCFGSNAGNNPTDTMPNANGGGSSVAALTNYSQGNLPSLGFPTDNVPCPNPTIFLQPNAGPAYSNYSTATPPPPLTSVNGAIYSAPNGGALPENITSVKAYGGTNIADALGTAIAMQLGTHTGDPTSTPSVSGPSGSVAAQTAPNPTLGRVGATRAIVLFTDGLPTAGGDQYASGAINFACSQQMAACANTASIPIYTIGLCMVPSLQTLQTTVLTDQGTAGIAAMSGHGATFSQTTSAAQLNNVFQNVARQLVQLVQ